MKKQRKNINHCIFKIKDFYVEVDGKNLSKKEIVRRLNLSFKKDIDDDVIQQYDFGIGENLISKVNSLKYESGKFEKHSTYYSGGVTVKLNCNLVDTID